MSRGINFPQHAFFFFFFFFFFRELEGELHDMWRGSGGGWGACWRHAVFERRKLQLLLTCPPVFSMYQYQSYLCDCLQLYTPSRTLRSASDTLSLQIPRTRLSTVGSRAFSVFRPSAWNDLRLPLRQKPSLDSFKSNLRTFLFPKL